ncbi:hypothetical protein Hanom_Chr10g00905741 [Helianthus anomalus]
MFIKKTNLKDDEVPIVADDVLSDDEWIANPSGDEDGIGGIGGSKCQMRKKVRVHHLGGKGKELLV